MKIKTSSGSEYLIENGMFIKNNHQWNSIWDMYFFDLKDLDVSIKSWETYFEYAKTMPKTYEPEVGKHMYISGKDVWWISTKIISVED